MRLLLCILMLMLAADLSAQPKSRTALGGIRADSVVIVPKKSPVHVWVSGGIGTGWTRASLNAFDACFSVNASYRGAYAIALRVANQSQINGHISPDQYNRDYAVMLGIRTSPKSTVYAAAYAGISRVNTQRRGAYIRSTWDWWVPGMTYYEPRYAAATGFPWEFQLVFKAGSNAGVGLTYFGDRNAVCSFSGLCVTAHLGWLE